MLLLAAACVRFAPDEPATPAASCTTGLDLTSPPPAVVLVTIDALNRRFLGFHHEEWDTTPRLDALFAEGVVLPNVLAPRSISAPSMASFMSGTYPRTHGIRANEGPIPEVTMLQEVFADAGWETYAYLSNQCYLADRGFDRRVCTWWQEAPEIESQLVGDQILVDALLADVASRSSTEPAFFWLHLMDVHDPYDRVEPWYSEFHPDAYDGAFADAEPASLGAATHGDLAYTDEDRREVEAVYASQLRHIDELLAAVFDGLDAQGLYEDAIVVVGADHGEELADRSEYFFHGCSAYAPALATTWAIRAPGRVAAGQVLEGLVSNTDIPLTITNLAGLTWPGGTAGISLVPDLHACTEPTHDVYLERGIGSAGIVRDGWKYFLNPEGDYPACIPYDASFPYPGEPEELYDMVNDPVEATNVLDAEPERAAELKDALCEWIGRASWVGETRDEGNVLVAACP